MVQHPCINDKSKSLPFQVINMSTCTKEIKKTNKKDLSYIILPNNNYILNYEYFSVKKRNCKHGKLAYRDSMPRRLGCLPCKCYTALEAYSTAEST